MPARSRPLQQQQTVPRIAMHKPCQITFQAMVASEPAKVEVHGWLARLHALTSDMVGGHVVINAVEERRKERRYLVRLELTMPNGVVVVEHGHARNAPHEDVYVAIRNAFRAAKIELEAYRAANPLPPEAVLPIVETPPPNQHAGEAEVPCGPHGLPSDPGSHPTA